MVFAWKTLVANSKVTLLRRVKTEAGWRYYPAAYAANGKVNPGVVIVNGQEVKHKAGFYGLRYYEGSHLVFESLKGSSPAAAEAARAKKKAEFAAIVHAKKEGIRIVPIDRTRPTLAVQLSQFLTATTARGSMEAAEVYELACREFMRVVGRQYSDEIVTGDFAKFHKALADRGMSARTVSNRHSSVKAFLRSIDYDTKHLPKPPKYDKTLPEIYTDKELKDLFRAVKSPRENLLYQLLLQTGMREQEAMFLEWSDIDPKRKICKLQSKQKQWDFRLKDFEEREIPLRDHLLVRLLEYRKKHAGDGTLIFGKHGKPDGHMLRTLKQQVLAVALNCGECEGCQKKTRECENWFLHKFRATFCTKLLRSGLDIRTIQSMMGHADLASTMRYLRPAENEQTQARMNSMRWT